MVNDKIDKNTKVNWPKLFWVHIFEMCQRQSLCLTKRADAYVFEITSSDSVTLSIESHTGKMSK